MIIHLDDERDVLNNAKRVFEEKYKLGFEYITCTTRNEFDEIISKNQEKIKGLIFDLHGKEAEREFGEKVEKEFLISLKKSFIQYNIPIFVYSGFLIDLSDELNSCATVFTFDKENGPDPVFEKLKLLYDSGFIDVFCPSGLLSQKLHEDLHEAFTRQFASNEEIENIIFSIKGSASLESVKERIKNVFTRIAVKALLSRFLAPEVDSEGKPIENTVNTIEHYIRRINNIPIWTGDVFQHNTKKEHIFILTPRCNVLRSDSILVCPLKLGETIHLDDVDKFSKMLYGDPKVSGYDRYVPSSAVFKGGKLTLSKYSMISRQELLGNYHLMISFSDELTNEIIGKFGAYFFRTGITPWNLDEATHQAKQYGRSAK